MRDEKGRILTAQVEIPAEKLQGGPRGYRVHVVDYDSTQGVFYRPAVIGAADAFARVDPRRLVSDPAFHAQNVYTLIMRTLARFEFALGRRVPWGFDGHQLLVAPHAFAGANAFYSERDRGLFFGYFKGMRGGLVCTCLSHDVVVHETCHALLDGLRDRYTDPSIPDQGGFHEAFGDIVALLSVFSLRAVVETLLKRSSAYQRGRLRVDELDRDLFRNSVLFGLADQMGDEVNALRGDALRRSVTLEPGRVSLQDPEFQEPHRRGEILVAAVMDAFARIWLSRVKKLDTAGQATVDVRRVAGQAADAAEHVLTMMIRAIDYCPPLDLRFGDFLSAMLTADAELVPLDEKYHYRQCLLSAFARWKIPPASNADDDDRNQRGLWESPERDLRLKRRLELSIDYSRVHLESLQRDPDEVFRFIWENRHALRLEEKAYTRVLTVRPCLRVGPDGFALRETVAEYVQLMDVTVGQLRRKPFLLSLPGPSVLPDDVVVRLEGGGTLVFNEFGRLKYHLRKYIGNAELQQEKLEALLREVGIDSENRLGFLPRSYEQHRFSELHRLRTGVYQRSQKGFPRGAR